MGFPETMALIAGTGLAITVIVVLARASCQLGKLSSQANSHEIAIRDLNGRVDHLDAKFDAKFDVLEAKFDARFDALTAAINELRDDMQQTNRILVGLANHTHDADGRAMFTIPS
ncbi:MAG: hypothetical protein OXL37_08440 [Chloroflexota bacterium]|nr:hypothetical protein [Chloroflexota bacterium]MDE2959619.1 hypothetical protein [Chloroflexota bacterium]